jgi:hypothetical protein
MFKSRELLPLQQEVAELANIVSKIRQLTPDEIKAQPLIDPNDLDAVYEAPAEAFEHVKGSYGLIKFDTPFYHFAREFFSPDSLVYVLGGKYYIAIYH